MLQTELKMAVHTLLEQAINRVAQVDPAWPHKTAPLAGKCLALVFTDIDQRLFFYFTGRDIMVRSVAEQPDVTLSGKLFDFFRQARQSGGSLAGKFRIQGDIETAQAFQTLLQSLDIDLEELLSQLIGRQYGGDIIAHKLGSLTRGLFDFGKQAFATSAHNLADYLQNESEIIPDADEIQRYSHGVDTLRDDLARLQAHIDRLARQIPP